VLRASNATFHTPTLIHEINAQPQPGSGSYSAGGGTLTNVTPTSTGTTAFTDFADLSFTSATITAYGAMIYNDTAAGNPSVCILDFGGAKTSTAGTFTIIFPTADASLAVVTLESRILAVVTASSSILAVVTASLARLALEIEPLNSL
jgi:hypothetical protein